MHITRVLSAMAAGSAGAILITSAAIAGTNSATSTTTGASAKFIADGDSITVCDTSSDGYSVYAQYRINGGATQTTSTVSSGSGTCASKSTGNPAEGSTVSVRAVRSGAGNAGAWVNGVA